MRRACREISNSHEHMLFSRLYQQITGRKESQFSVGYDLTAGLERYRTWLREHTEDPTAPDTAEATRVATLPAGPGAAGADPEREDGGTRADTLAGTLVATGALMPDAFPVSGTARAEWSADHAVIELYSMHYRSLVRLAALLLRDTPTAEEVVQDAFVAMHGGWQRLRDTEKALAYLRQAVVNRARSVLRHRMVVEKNLQSAPPDMPSAEHGAFALLERSAVVAALRNLPDRQREAIVLRYYGDLSEAEIAATMGISCGAVKSHTSRGMAALRTALEQELWREPDPAPRASARSGSTSPTSSGGRCTRRRTKSSRRPTAWPRSARGSGPGPAPRRASRSRFATSRGGARPGDRRRDRDTQDGPFGINVVYRGGRRGTFLGTAAGQSYYGRYDRAG